MYGSQQCHIGFVISFLSLVRIIITTIIIIIIIIVILMQFIRHFNVVGSLQEC